MSLDLLRYAPWLTGERIFRFALVFAAATLAAVGLDFWAHTRAGLTDAAGEHLARDFVNYWASGRAALGGEGARVYDIDGFLALQRSLVGQGAEFKIYSYPPVALLFTAPLGLLSYPLALGVWMALGAGVSAWLLARSIGWPLAVLASLGAPAVLLNALGGQNGQLSAALFAGGLMLLTRRPVLAGLLLGALCYKPQLGVLIPFALAAGGHWRAFAAAAVAVAALVAASAAVFGIEAWTGFLHTMVAERVLMEQGDGFWRRMPTFFAGLRLLGAPPAAGYAAQAVSSLAAILAVVAVWRGKAPIPVKGAALMVATVLASPYAWDYDLVVLTFAVAWLAVEGVRTGFRPWEKLTLAATMAGPLLLGPIGDFTRLQLGPVLLWLLLGLILGRAAQEVPVSVASTAASPSLKLG